MVTLAFVGLILAFVLLDLLVVRKLERRGPFAGATTEGDDASTAAELTMPRGYFFHPGHVWARIQSDGRVLVGVDDFVRTVLGGITALRLPEPGQSVREGRSAFRLASGGNELAFMAPLSGKVAAVNAAAIADPKLVDDGPYDQGWLLAIEPEPGPCREIAALVIAEAAADWMRGELDHLRGFIGEHRPGASLQGLLAGAASGVWSAFQAGFLDRRTGKEAEA
jgi:glycine cleavage system H lipoate-binding protein